MINIDISLSTESISKAIADLAAYREILEEGVEQVVDILTQEGAEVASAGYGNFGVGVTHQAEGTQGEITAYGDHDELLIAEFGAGQATMPVMFEGSPYAAVYEGAFSESPRGSGEYAKFGSWHFGGGYYTEIPARHGLLDAKEYIIENSTDIAQEVFGA